MPDESVRAGRRGGGDDLFVGGVGTPVRDVVADGDGEQEGLVEDHADVGPQARQGEVAHVVAVDEDGALGDVVEAGHEPGHGRLAAAGPSDQGNRLTRAQMEVEVGEHVGVPAVFDREGDPAGRAIGEGDVVEADVAGAVDEVDRAGPIDDGGLLVEDLVDALGRSGGTLAHHDQHAEHHEGCLHHQQVDVEFEDRPQLELPVDDEVAPEHEDEDEPHLGEVLDQRRETGPQVGILDVGPLHLFGGRRHLPELLLFGGERLDHAHAVGVLVDHGGHVGQAGLDHP